MKKTLKKIVKNLGYKVSKINSAKLQQDDYLYAVKDEIANVQPVIFDIGANQGQTLRKILKVYPQADIHIFEPNKYLANYLSENFEGANVKINNSAVGEKIDSLDFHQYEWDALSSLLKRSFTSSKIKEVYKVPVISLDAYCGSNNIEKIHFLKTDTEGYELNVLKGAKNLLRENKVQFIHIELFFTSNFLGQASVGEIFTFLEKYNFSLVRFYDVSLSAEGWASKCDALFINEKF